MRFERHRLGDRCYLFSGSGGAAGGGAMAAGAVFGAQGDAGVSLISFRGMGLAYMPKYIISSLLTGVQTILFSKNKVTSFDIDFSNVAESLITLDFSDNLATEILDTTNTFGQLGSLKELYLRNLKCGTFNNLSIPNLSLLEKIDARNGLMNTALTLSISLTNLIYLHLGGNRLGDTEAQTQVNNLADLLDVSTKQDGYFDMMGTYSYPQSPEYTFPVNNVGNVGTVGDALEILNSNGDTIIRAILTNTTGQLKAALRWLSATEMGTLTGYNSIRGPLGTELIISAVASLELAKIKNQYSWTTNVIGQEIL